VLAVTRRAALCVFTALLLLGSVSDAQSLPANADDLTAQFGPPPRTQAELEGAAAQRWLDQENRGRIEAGFPVDLLARRSSMLDREAENILRGQHDEPALPPLLDPLPGETHPGALHANVRTCTPNCEPFWTVPDRLVDLLPHAASGELPDFDRYVQRQRWTAHYWNAYRLFGIAARVQPEREIVAHRERVRAAVEDVAPGGAELWDPRALAVEWVVVGSDPWPNP
jgi:hypothetical protein